MRTLPTGPRRRRNQIRRIRSAARLLGYVDRCVAAAGTEQEPNEIRAYEPASARVEAELEAPERAPRAAARKSRVES